MIRQVVFRLRFTSYLLIMMEKNLRGMIASHYNIFPKLCLCLIASMPLSLEILFHRSRHHTILTATQPIGHGPHLSASLTMMMLNFRTSFRPRVTLGDGHKAEMCHTIFGCCNHACCCFSRWVFGGMFSDDTPPL